MEVLFLLVLIFVVVVVFANQKGKTSEQTIRRQLQGKGFRAIGIASQQGAGPGGRRLYAVTCRDAGWNRHSLSVELGKDGDVTILKDTPLKDDVHVGAGSRQGRRAPANRPSVMPPPPGGSGGPRQSPPEPKPTASPRPKETLGMMSLPKLNEMIEHVQKTLTEVKVQVTVLSVRVDKLERRLDALGRSSGTPEPPDKTPRKKKDDLEVRRGEPSGGDIIEPMG